MFYAWRTSILIIHQNNRSAKFDLAKITILCPPPAKIVVGLMLLNLERREKINCHSVYYQMFY